MMFGEPLERRKNAARPRVDLLPPLSGSPIQCDAVDALQKLRPGTLPASAEIAQ
jgi:hypothetical protein